jgi:hypothetical protein
MAITTTMCASFKQELLEAEHDFTADTFKVALYADTATLGASTTVYSTSDEVSGAGYTAGGETLTVVAPTISNNVAYVDFNDASWSNSTITARGMLIYNSSKSNKAVAAYDFGANQSSSSSTFTVEFPAAASGTAIVRIE